MGGTVKFHNVQITSFRPAPPINVVFEVHVMLVLYIVHWLL